MRDRLLTLVATGAERVRTRLARMKASNPTWSCQHREEGGWNKRPASLLPVTAPSRLIGLRPAAAVRGARSLASGCRPRLILQRLLGGDGACLSLARLQEVPGPLAGPSAAAKATDIKIIKIDVLEARDHVELLKCTITFLIARRMSIFYCL